MRWVDLGLMRPPYDHIVLVRGHGDLALAYIPRDKYDEFYCVDLRGPDMPLTFNATHWCDIPGFED